MFMQLQDISGKKSEEAIKLIENYLRANQEILEYTLTHLDSTNIIEIDTTKTTIYKGEDDGV